MVAPLPLDAEGPLSGQRTMMVVMAWQLGPLMVHLTFFRPPAPIIPIPSESTVQGISSETCSAFLNLTNEEKPRG